MNCGVMQPRVFLFYWRKFFSTLSWMKFLFCVKHYLFLVKGLSCSHEVRLWDSNLRRSAPRAEVSVRSLGLSFLVTFCSAVTLRQSLWLCVPFWVAFRAGRLGRGESPLLSEAVSNALTGKCSSRLNAIREIPPPQSAEQVAVWMSELCSLWSVVTAACKDMQIREQRRRCQDLHFTF